MKKLFYIIAIWHCALLSVSCSSDEELQVNSASVPLEIQLADCMTRASIVEGSSLPYQSSFGIFGLKRGVVISDLKNMSVLYNGTCQLAEPVYLDDTLLRIVAYYPYMEGLSNTTVSLDIRDQVDFLYGNSIADNGEVQWVSAQNPIATIGFKHALSRVTFRVKHTESYGDDFTLNELFISPIYLTASFDLLTQQLTPIKMNEPTFPIDITVTQEFTSVDLLMIPLGVNEHPRGMILRKTGDVGQWINIPEGAWEAGQQYTYDIIYDSKGDIQISQAVITPWQSNTLSEIEITDENLVTD